MNMRLSHANDQRALQKLISEIYTDFRLKNQKALFNWSDDQVTSLFLFYQFVLASAENGDPLAFICFQELGGDFEIITLGVHPSHQHQGCMRGLFKFFVENICTKGSKIFLEVHENNQPAIAFYEQAGFKIDGIRRNYYSDGAAAANMSLDLSSCQ